MLNIIIENPKIEEFVRNEFHGDTGVFVQNIYDFMRFYKIKKEIDEAKKEIASGVFIEEDELFDGILKAKAKIGYLTPIFKKKAKRASVVDEARG